MSALLLCVLLAAPAGASGTVTLAYDVQKVVRDTAEEGTGSVELAAAERLLPGDELVYTITFANSGTEALAAGTVAIVNPIPATLEYVAGSAAGADADVEFSIDGGRTFGPSSDLLAAGGASAFTTIRWIYRPPLEAGASSQVSFHARLK
jgi:uncharacterized repeat protein (TIGR01451 family)